jgi:hypothetical protein
MAGAIVDGTGFQPNLRAISRTHPLIRSAPTKKKQVHA